MVKRLEWRFTVVRSWRVVVGWLEEVREEVLWFCYISLLQVVGKMVEEKIQMNSVRLVTLSQVRVG